jgi:hypothetical protein
LPRPAISSFPEVAGFQKISCRKAFREDPLARRAPEIAMVAWRWAEPCSRARAGVAGKLVGRGEPGARTARAGDELGAETPGVPVSLVIMMASCWARNPERWWRPVRRRAAGRAQALLGETGDQ